MSNDLDLALTSLGDDNVVAQVADAALDLDAVVEELLEGGDIEDLVRGGLRSIDDVLYREQTLVTRNEVALAWNRL